MKIEEPVICFASSIEFGTKIISLLSDFGVKSKMDEGDRIIGYPIKVNCVDVVSAQQALIASKISDSNMILQGPAQREIIEEQSVLGQE